MFGEDHVVLKGNGGGISGHLQGTNGGGVPIENCLPIREDHQNIITKVSPPGR